MDYIINPAWVYWINVLSGLKIAFVCFAVLLAFAIVMEVIVAAENRGFGADDKDYIAAKTMLKHTAPFFVVFLLAAVFIPSKQTMLQMMVARLATRQNIELTVDGLKSVVDYIAETVKSLK